MVTRGAHAHSTRSRAHPTTSHLPFYHLSPLRLTTGSMPPYLYTSAPPFAAHSILRRFCSTWLQTTTEFIGRTDVTRCFLTMPDATFTYAAPRAGSPCDTRYWRLFPIRNSPYSWAATPLLRPPFSLIPRRAACPGCRTRPASPPPCRPSCRYPFSVMVPPFICLPPSLPYLYYRTHHFCTRLSLHARDGRYGITWALHYGARAL